MIALIGLELRHSLPGVELLDALPNPPALRYSGFLVYCCAPRLDVTDVMRWYSGIRDARSRVPLGLVCRAKPECFPVLASQGFAITPVITSRLDDGQLPPETLDILRARTVDGMILDRWRTCFCDAIEANEEHFFRLASHGARGDLVQRVAKSWGVSPRTLRRRHALLTPHPLGLFMLDARVFAFDMLRQEGNSAAVARQSCGWHTVDAVRKARWRLRNKITEDWPELGRKASDLSHRLPAPSGSS